MLYILSAPLMHPQHGVIRERLYRTPLQILTHLMLRKPSIRGLSRGSTWAKTLFIRQSCVKIH